MIGIMNANIRQQIRLSKKCLNSRFHESKGNPYEANYYSNKMNDVLMLERKN